MPPIPDRLLAFAKRAAAWLPAAVRNSWHWIRQYLRPVFWMRFCRALPALVWAVAVAWGRSAAGILTLIGSIPLRRVFIAACITLALIIVGFYTLLRLPSTQVAYHLPERRIVYLEQGWGPTATSDYRQKWYYTPQGTSLLGNKLRYSWLVNLERNDGQRFIQPDHMRALGFVVDNIATKANPDRLPVGFTKHWDPEVNEDILDITCAACHTGELHLRIDGEETAIRIDGGQAMHAFTSTSVGQFGLTLVAAMGETAFQPWRFNRFARRVLGEKYYSGRFALWRDFAWVWCGLAWGAIRDARLGLYPVEEGFGRTDAVGRISNNVFGAEIDPKNFSPADAPVSYPALWDAPRFDFVQYTHSVAQPMARNLGESLGVGAVMTAVDAYGRPLPPDHPLSSTSAIKNLTEIEDYLSDLRAPRWPEELLGKIDRDKAARGEKLFEKYCAHCHVPCAETPQMMAVERPLRDPRNPLWRVTPIPVETVGTDPRAALNFVNTHIDLTRAGLDRRVVVDEERRILEEQARRVRKFDPKAADALQASIQQKLDGIDLANTTIGGGLHILDTLITRRVYTELNLTDHEKQVYDGEGALDLPVVAMQYRPRPLEGVWATGPYLHNGSVPTLYEMLIPASKRTKRFFISSRMDFDPVRVGLVASPTSEKGFWLDTTIPGNLNIGHEFRAGYPGCPDHGVIGPELTEDERWAIIEYLKIHRDNPPPCKNPPVPTPPLACAK